MACKERGPDTVPDFEELEGADNFRQGQGKVEVPWLALYHGQTGYPANVRGGEHQNDQRANKTSNAMTRLPQVAEGAAPDAGDLPPQGASGQAAEGGGGHRCWQPDHPPQLKRRVPSRGSAEHQNAERIWELVLFKCC